MIIPVCLAVFSQFPAVPVHGASINSFDAIGIAQAGFNLPAQPSVVTANGSAFCQPADIHSFSAGSNLNSYEESSNYFGSGLERSVLVGI